MADAVETAGLPETQASLPSPVEPEQSAHDAGTAFDRLDAAVLRHIVRWLPLRDVAAAAQACRALRDVVSEQETWHDKALQILGADELAAREPSDYRQLVRSLVDDYRNAAEHFVDGSAKGVFLVDDVVHAIKQAPRLMQLARVHRALGSPVTKMGELLDEYTVEMETQALLRFEVAYDAQDTSAMKSNYEVLRVLGFAKSAAQPFLAKHPLFMDVESVLPSASGRCGSPEEVEVFMTDFLGKLSPILEDQNKIIDVVFGADAGRVMLLFVERVFEQTVSEHIGAALQAAVNDCATYLRTLSFVFNATKSMLDRLNWTALCPSNPDGRKQELLESTFMGRLGNYLRMEEEWIFAVFRGAVLRTVDIIRNESVRAKMLEGFDMVVKNHSKSVQYDLSAQLFGGAFVAVALISAVNVAAPMTPSTPLQPSRPPTLPELISLESAIYLKNTVNDALSRAEAVRFVSEAQFLCTFETLFQLFVDLMENCLLRPALEHVIAVMNTMPESTDVTHDTVAAARDLSTGFFDLVHLADTLQQIVQALFEARIEPLLTGKDQKTVAMKKRFERVLDELVADGINKSLDLLMWRTDRILEVEQSKDDYGRHEVPPTDELKPTKACQFAVDIVNSHAEAVVLVVEEGVRETLLNEIGLRLFTHIINHLKKFTVSAEGARQLSCDLQHYSNLLTRLNAGKEGRLQASSLQIIGKMFVLSADELVSVLQAAEDIEGVEQFSPEDLRGFVRNRSDYRKIAWTVDRAQNCSIF